ncbi:MAG: SH3 domain-containing protein [Lachnospiraceae bacterium]|nr:SH3 domain-containing protein [Lachnospiraceae bacterium]
METRSRYLSTAALLIVFGIFLIYNLCFPKEYPQTMHVVVAACKVRAGAGHEFDIVGVLPQGETVTVLGIAEDDEHYTWYKIDPRRLPEDKIIDSEEYYIRSDLLVMDSVYD